jgi:hypothetical protein
MESKPNTTPGKKLLGILAEFGSPNELIAAAGKLHQSGYHRFECHSPFPIPAIDEAAGEERSKVSLVAGIMAALGLGGAFTLEAWTSSIDYPLIVSGKPFLSYQAFVPIAFAGAILFAAFGAVISFLAFMDLKFHHPVFYSDRFASFSDNGFFVSIEASDKHFDPIVTREFLEELGGEHIELLEGE